MKKIHVALTTLALVLTACGQSDLQTSSAQTSGAAVQPTSGRAGSLSTLPTDPYAQTAPLSEQATEPYNITLNFAAGSDSRVVSAMQAAAARWQGIVTQGLPAVTVNIPANACGSNAAYSGTVDDILVFTGSKYIDGPGGILAQSGPCSVRGASGLTTYSTLIFDSADLSTFATQLPSIAMHELGHSLGIGSLWKMKSLTTGSGTTDPRYVGANGKREYAALGGTLGSVPEENQGGSGTAEAHWREKTLNNELMTGYLNSGSNPLSRLSIAGLQDLGYAVDYTRADAFSTGSINTLSAPLDLSAHEQVLEPRWQVK